MSSNRVKSKRSQSSRQPKTPSPLKMKTSAGKRTPTTTERSGKLTQYQTRYDPETGKPIISMKVYPNRFGTPQNISFKKKTKENASRLLRNYYARSKNIQKSDGSVSSQTRSDLSYGSVTPTVSVKSDSLGGSKNKVDYGLINSILKSFGADCKCNDNIRKGNRKKRQNNKKSNRKK